MAETGELIGPADVGGFKPDGRSRGMTAPFCPQVRNFARSSGVNTISAIDSPNYYLKKSTAVECCSVVL
jgi:hypothetical protein